MMDNTGAAALKNKSSSDIRVLVVAENKHQRIAFSDTVRSCGFKLVDCIARDQLAEKRADLQVDIWLIDSDYDDIIANAIVVSNASATLVGFNQAPPLNEIQYYAKWQRKLKRKLSQVLAMPELIDTAAYTSSTPPWRHVVFLGASMGGPRAVKEFLDHLSPTLPICILLAHHFNKDMIETLPRVLNRNNDWRCQVVKTTQRLRSGHCLIAPIDRQIVCDSEGRVIVATHDWTGEHKPAIGQLLKNASDVYGSDLISIIFSGMGNDGSQYLDSIQDNHSQLWAQDPSLSLCPSQPQAIIDSGYCQFIGSPAALAAQLTEHIDKMTTTNFAL